MLSNMVRINKLYILYLIMTSMLGCNTVTSNLLENVADPKQYMLHDFPFPQGSQIDSHKSLIFGAGSHWIGRLVIVASKSSGEMFVFFRESLSAQGWSLISASRSKSSVLIFQKDVRVINVEVNDSGVLSSGSEIIITATPKSGVESLGVKVK